MKANDAQHDEAPAAAGNEIAAEILRLMGAGDWSAALARAPLLRPETFSEVEDAQAACWGLLLFEAPLGIRRDSGFDAEQLLKRTLTEADRRIGTERLGRVLEMISAERSDDENGLTGKSSDFPPGLAAAADFVSDMLCVTRQLNEYLDGTEYSSGFFDDTVELLENYCIRLIGLLAAADGSEPTESRGRAAQALRDCFYYFANHGLNGGCPICLSFQTEWTQLMKHNTSDGKYQQVMMECRNVIDECKKRYY